MLYEKVLKMGNVDFTDISKFSHEQWLALRRTGIGGSDAGAIMGLNKYSTPLSVYLSKKDFASFGGNKATEWGNLLEDPVRQKAKEELGIQIETVPGMFTSKEHEFMNANFDGLVFIDGTKGIAGTEVSGLGGHEIKTSRTGEGFGEDEVPDSYYAQVQHYMAVTGIKFFVLTVFIIDQYSGRHYVIPRNEDFIAKLVEAESTFWNNHVVLNNPPAPTGNENETELVKSLPMPGSVELPSEFEEFLNFKADVDSKIKQLQKESDAIKEKILLKMSEYAEDNNEERTTATCGTWKITYNLQKRISVDTDELKKAGLFEQFSKESSCKVLRISGGKK